MLDELEKAHPDVLNVLLQILEDGMLTDGKGRTVNFKNTILIMTSNVGSQRIMELSKLKLAAQRGAEPNGGKDVAQAAADALYAKLSGVVKDELEQTMRPELLNRMDEIVVFSPLSDLDLQSIAQLTMDRVIERAETEQDLSLKATPTLIRIVTDEGSANAAQFGARPMRRAAQRFFEDAVSDSIVRGFLERGDDAVVDLKPERELERHYVVEVRRSRDSETLEVLVDKVTGGIGSSARDDQPVLQEDTEDSDGASERKKKKKRSFSDEVEVEAQS